MHQRAISRASSQFYCTDKLFQPAQGLKTVPTSPHPDKVAVVDPKLFHLVSRKTKAIAVGHRGTTRHLSPTVKLSFSVKIRRGTIDAFRPAYCSTHNQKNLNHWTIEVVKTGQMTKRSKNRAPPRNWLWSRLFDQFVPFSSRSPHSSRVFLYRRVNFEFSQKF